MNPTPLAERELLEFVREYNTLKQIPPTAPRGRILRARADALARTRRSAPPRDGNNTAPTFAPVFPPLTDVRVRAAQEELRPPAWQAPWRCLTALLQAHRDPRPLLLTFQGSSASVCAEGVGGWRDFLERSFRDGDYDFTGIIRGAVLARLPEWNKLTKAESERLVAEFNGFRKAHRIRAPAKPNLIPPAVRSTPAAAAARRSLAQDALVSRESVQQKVQEGRNTIAKARRDVAAATGRDSRRLKRLQQHPNAAELPKLVGTRAAALLMEDDRLLQQFFAELPQRSE